MQFIKFCFLILFVFFVNTLKAQSTIEVTFNIQDSSKTALVFAEVTFLKTTDSVVFNNSFPDEAGNVKYEMEAQSFLIHIECLDFADTFILVTNPIQDVHLGAIILRPKKSNLLNEVVITSQRNAMELHIDKRVYNVAADINTQGATASEVLENIPSVTVDAEGNVSLRGNSNVRILVDGKLSGFASTADALKMLQADAIEKIEVVTNASSRYDAEGDAGIINIILKKGRKQGFNAVFNARAGYNPDNGAGIRLNYKFKKLNVFADYNYNYSKHPGLSTTYQKLSNADTQMAYRQFYNQSRVKNRHSMRVGADYDWNDKNNTSIDFNYRTGVGDNFIERIYENYDPKDALLNIDTRNENNTELEDLIELNLSHDYKFSDKGSWKTAFSYYKDNDLEKSLYDESNSLSSTIRLEDSRAYIYNDVWQGQTDLVLPIGKDGKLETGLKFQNRIFENEFRYRQQIATDEWESPVRFNDDVRYDEKVYAAYLMGATTIQKWGMQAGLRAEYSDIETWQKSTTPNKVSYINFFPSAAVSYKLNEQNNFQASLSRRISRPGQWDLLPFMKFGDNREMRIGDPNLKPELTYSTEVTWMRYLKKGSILSSLYYRHTDNKIERMAFYGTDGIIYRAPMNIAQRKAIGVELIGSYQLTRWLRFNTNFNFYRDQIIGKLGNEQFDRSNFTWNNRTSFNILLPQDWKFQVSGQYDAPRVSPQGKILSMQWMDLAISKDILKQKASIGLNVRDVFNSRRFRSITDTDEIYSESNFQWRPRGIRLTFTYRLNQSKKEQEQFFNGDGGGAEM